MAVIDIIGFLGALIIGLVLGLIGGGGSILTVPVLVYLLHINPVTATAYSLFVVGVSSLVGAASYARNKLVDFKTAFIFSIPAFIAVYSTRKYIVPAIPDTIWSTSHFVLSKNTGIMLLFAVIMVLAAVSMMRKTSDIDEHHTNVNPIKRYSLIAIEGVVVGILTGLVGAGGGFLIIPALVLLAKLPIKKAIATSLLIIAVKSLIGFLGDIQNMPIDWTFLLGFTGVAVIGIFLGSYLSHLIHGDKLKKAFAWFVLLMGFYIIWKELFA